MLHTKALKFQYENGPSFSFPDIHCANGEHLLIIGESGKGKTTLLHLLAGMLRPTSGAVEINGENTSDMSNRQLDEFRGKNIGIVFQTAHFVQSLNVEQNLMLPPFLSGKAMDPGRIEHVLQKLNLAGKSKKKPSQLSTGEAQRAAIARAVVNHPILVLADEPTSALDDKNTTDVIDLLESQAKLTGSTLIIVTHDKRLKDRFPKSIEL